MHVSSNTGLENVPQSYNPIPSPSHLLHLADSLPPSPSGVGSRSCVACPEGTWADETGFQCVQCGVSNCQQCTSVSSHTRTHTRARIYAHTCIHRHKHTCTYSMHTYTHTHHAHMHTCTHAHTQTHAHMHLHTHMQHSSVSYHFHRWLMVCVLAQGSFPPLLLMCSATIVSTSVQL